jgi:hypothetical protein
MEETKALNIELEMRPALMSKGTVFYLADGGIWCHDKQEEALRP